MKASKVEQHSAAVVGSSFDLLPLILINLPIKSLARFKSVCKQWKFIIGEDRDFATKYSGKSSLSPCGVFVNPFYYSRDKTTEFVPLFGNPSGYVPSLCFLDRIRNNLVEQILSYKDHGVIRLLVEKGLAQQILSCNGLLFCIFGGVENPMFPFPFPFPDNQKPVLVVCNPTTKHFKILPQIPVEKSVEKGCLGGFTLAFSPSESPHYKVVAVKWCRDCSELEILRYSTETDRWELARCIAVPERHLPYATNGVFSNGSVYWLQSRNRMLYYNLNYDDFGTVDLPQEVRGCLSHLVGSCGRVFLVVVFFNRVDQDNIYEFHSSNKQWSFITRQQRQRSMVVIPSKPEHCEYVPSLAPL